MPKTGAVIYRSKHWNKTYEIFIGSQKKIFFHDENDVTSVGDTVEIVNAGRKISKRKSFILDRVVHKNPVELGMIRDNIDSKEALKRLYHVEQEVLGAQHVELRKEVPLHQLRMKQAKQLEVTEKKREERIKKIAKKSRARFNKKLRKQGINPETYWEQIAEGNQGAAAVESTTATQAEQL
eukprot:CAMPEP_0117435082 /NCGR_PEP_ID=MMETSP0759-20121206/290_1 /TAXON_ID=63605 /ORGANISM="Percolomonas cosmopolitus, Strain WS" /LENGTH=180 /DNA_ID=CAMNT_0005226603 /DNA_START=365 /DNA_END=907 /DNA_ORIENTATION=+